MKIYRKSFAKKSLLFSGSFCSYAYVLLMIKVQGLEISENY